MCINKEWLCPEPLNAYVCVCLYALYGVALGHHREVLREAESTDNAVAADTTVRTQKTNINVNEREFTMMIDEEGEEERKNMMSMPGEVQSQPSDYDLDEFKTPEPPGFTEMTETSIESPSVTVDLEKQSVFDFLHALMNREHKRTNEECIQLVTEALRQRKIRAKQKAQEDPQCTVMACSTMFANVNLNNDKASKDFWAREVHHELSCNPRNPSLITARLWWDKQSMKCPKCKTEQAILRWSEVALNYVIQGVCCFMCRIPLTMNDMAWWCPQCAKFWLCKSCWDQPSAKLNNNGRSSICAYVDPTAIKQTQKILWKCVAEGWVIPRRSVKEHWQTQ